jgi:hypothetical protein
MTETLTTLKMGYSPELKGVRRYDAELEPYASLFLKPLTNKKSAFSKKELEVMCNDPLHSPRLILYLIEFFKNM